MGEEVIIASMRDASEAVADAKVADVKALFYTHVNDGKIVLVVEGPDDKEVYEGFTNSTSVCIYVDCNCEKHFVILNALNERYGDRLLAIKDADFDRLDGNCHPFFNLVLTDTHDMEGMIVEASLSSLQEEDAERCQNIKLADIYSELEDISYLKWFNHWNHCGINFSETALDLNVESYFNACISATNQTVSVDLSDVHAFKLAHQGVDKKELCNGHDIFERIYVRAHSAKVSNFAKKPFFRRLRRAYSYEEFLKTLLYKDIKAWETATGNTVLASI